VESVEINRRCKRIRRGRDWRVGEPGDEDGGRAANDCVQPHGGLTRLRGTRRAVEATGTLGSGRLAEAIRRVGGWFVRLERARD